MGEVGVQTDLAAWLGQCIDEDERLARSAADAVPYDERAPIGPRWTGDGGLVRGAPRRWESFGDYEPALWDCEGSDTLCMPEAASTHVATWDPARVLAECESKRRVVEMYMEECRSLEAWPGSGHSEVEVESLASIETLGGVLRLIAVVYKDRDGYRAEWSPDGR